MSKEIMAKFKAVFQNFPLGTEQKSLKIPARTFGILAKVLTEHLLNKSQKNYHVN
jgi:hypothetical protein